MERSYVDSPGGPKHTAWESANFHDFSPIWGKKTKVITFIAIGTIASLVGFFLLLAGLQILPQGLNAISQWGIGGNLGSGIILGLGLLSMGYGVTKWFREEMPTYLIMRKVENVAEESLDHGPISNLPPEALTHILSYLDICDLQVAEMTCRFWRDCSTLLWKKYAEVKLSVGVASKLFESRMTWRDVLLDLNRPLKPNSYELSHPTLRYNNFWEKKPELTRVLDCAKEPNTRELEEALVQLENAAKLGQLNCRDLGSYTPLEIAAMYGRVGNAQLLIKYGAQDALTGGSYVSVDGVVGKSALYYAVFNGHVEMVQFLLEHGARPDLSLEENGYNIYFLPYLLNQYHQKRDHSDNKNYLECLILLINAWKTQKGHQEVCNHKDAKEAFEVALSNGHSDISYLLIGLGIRINPSELRLAHVIDDAIINKNLSMIKLLNEKSFFDFINFRNQSGATILHTCFALDSDEILEYLIQIGVPTGAKNHCEETYQVSGRKKLEKKVLRAMANGLHGFSGCYDVKSGLQMESLEACLMKISDLNMSVDTAGNTLLHIAVKWIFHSERNRTDGIIHKLLERGADPHRKNNEDVTPLMVAQKVFDDEEKEWCAKEDYESAAALIEKMTSISTAQ